LDSMKISEIRLQRYTLELARPLTIKGHALENRSGLILSVIDSTGQIGYGEIAPLPFLHKETIEEAILCASKISQTLIKIEIQNKITPYGDLLAESVGVDLPPSVLFGLEMAVFDLYLQQNRVRQQLSKLKVPLCGLTSTASEDFYRDLQEMLKQGFLAVKIKVGANSIAEDASRINASKEIIQNKMKLRLDANRSWDLKEARAFCGQIGSEGIDYIEEPVKDVCDQKTFVNKTGFPLALDETLLDNSFNSTTDLEHVAAFVIKPDLVGGLRHSAELIRLARPNKITPVLSSSFQSGLAIRSLFIFAVEMGLSDIPVGLDTLKWFAEDCLVQKISVENGFVSLQQLLEQRPCFKGALLNDV
ncbi:MAG: o-succinylbenzoate synthase, partial [Planctomycetota bacterium]